MRNFRLWQYYQGRSKACGARKLPSAINNNAMHPDARPSLLTEFGIPAWRKSEPEYHDQLGSKSSLTTGSFSWATAKALYSGIDEIGVRQWKEQKRS